MSRWKFAQILVSSAAMSAFMMAPLAIQGPVAAAERSERVPDLSGAWVSLNSFGLRSPPSGPGPLGDLQGYSHFGFGVDEARRAVNSNPWIGDYRSAILTPWAAAILKEKAETAIKGEDPFWAQSNCWPGGMASVLWAGPRYFVQTKDVVYIIYARDHDVRRVYMNQQHSNRHRPSWYGESVGHYEGDVLVVDTLGFNGKAFIDRYGTPHSDKLHVVERYKVLADGKTLEVTLTYQDPTAFATTWSAIVRYNRTEDPLTEEACSEAAGNPVTGKFYPIPIAENPDF